MINRLYPKTNNYTIKDMYIDPLSSGNQTWFAGKHPI